MRHPSLQELANLIGKADPTRDYQGKRLGAVTLKCSNCPETFRLGEAPFEVTLRDPGRPYKCYLFGASLAADPGWVTNRVVEVALGCPPNRR